jgi:hypothetical protein
VQWAEADVRLILRNVAVHDGAPGAVPALRITFPLGAVVEDTVTATMVRPTTFSAVVAATKSIVVEAVGTFSANAESESTPTHVDALAHETLCREPPDARFAVVSQWLPSKT